MPRKKEGRAARLAAMMESQGMKTEGTALAGLLQQEREALEKAAAEENGSDDPSAEVDAKIDGGLENEGTDVGSVTGLGLADPTQQSMRGTVTA